MIKNVQLERPPTYAMDFAFHREGIQLYLFQFPVSNDGYAA